LELIESQIEDSAFLDSFAAELKSALTGAGLGEFENSNPIKAAINTAKPLAEAIGVEAKFAAARAGNPHGELMNAVDDLVAFRFSFGQLADVAEIPSDDSIKSTLCECFESLREQLRVAKQKLDDVRGFTKLDRDCWDPTAGPALRVFAPSWNEFRGFANSSDVDAVAAAIVAGDVATLGQLIGGRKPVDIKIDCDALPPEVPRLTKNASVRLLEVASFVGGAPLRFLLEFFGIKPSVVELHQAVASGDSDTIRTIWDRMNPSALVGHLGALAVTAAEFHHVEVVNWLIFDGRPHQLRHARRAAEERLLFDVVLRMPEPPASKGLFAGSMAADFEEVLQEWLPETTTATLLAKHEGRDKASINAFIDAAVGHQKTLTFVQTENGESICGSFLAPAWDIGDEGITRDARRESFMFTLKNSLGVLPKTFAMAAGETQAARLCRDVGAGCGIRDGWEIFDFDSPMPNGNRYEAPAQGTALFHADDRGVFRCGRWELWQTA
jgi:hypothetical protein